MKILGIIFAIVLFVILIIIHELGHLLAAKICGVRVNEFSVGMGPLIFQTEKGDTSYSIRAVPLGGYCRLEGEDEESDDPNSFRNAKWYKRVFILVAGAFNNIVFCLLVLFFVFLSIGSSSSTIGSVTPGGPAYVSGVQPGDRIVAVDEVRSDDWMTLVEAISSSGDTIRLTVVRDGNEKQFVVTPEYNEEVGRKVIGITGTLVHSPKGAIKESFQVSIDYFRSFRDFILGLFTGTSNSNDVVGFVGIVNVISEEAQYGIVNVIYLIAIISLNLGVVNLLPIPALDGGQILLTIIRALSKGKLSENVERAVNAIGMLLLISLMVFLIFKDSYNIIFK